MPIFTPDFINFFQELSKNNNKEWFHTHKKRYETSVKHPFENLVGQLIDQIQGYDPEIVISPKDAILRINRDIRFARDKSPYNTFVTAFISRQGRKDKSIPGFFIRLAPDMLGIMCGCYSPNKKQLGGIREAILQQSARWKSIINDPTFRESFGEVKGQQYKRLPAPYAQEVERLPVLANKQFYLLKELPSTIIISDQLVNELMQYWHAAQPFNQFLMNAINK